MTRYAFIPPPTKNTLLVVLRAAGGRITHVPIGSAYLDKNWGGAISLLPARYPDEPCLEDFHCDTPRQARAAFKKLAELECVDVDPADFQTRWYEPREGIAAVRGLLAHESRKARALLTEPVRAELERILRVLESAQRLAYTFYFTEVEAGASKRFAGAEWGVGQENNEMHLTRSAKSSRRGPRR
jgi:hypothetical protein